MKISFSKRALIFLLAIFLVLPAFSACSKAITLDDAKYTMGKFFSAIGAGDLDSAAALMHISTGITAGRVETYLAEVEDKVGGSFNDGISNIRYTSFEQLPYNGVPGGSKFRVYGTLNIGKAVGVSFIISLIMDGDGYGISVVDFNGVDL